MRVDFEVRSLRSEAGSPEEYLEQLASTAPPLVAAKQAMAPEPYEAMKAEILEHVRSESGDGPVVLDNDYALIGPQAPSAARPRIRRLRVRRLGAPAGPAERPGGRGGGARHCVAPPR